MLLQPTAISETGCWIGLDKWTYGFTAIILVKLIIECASFISFKRYN
jgi:hypothetical protein